MKETVDQLETKIQQSALSPEEKADMENLILKLRRDMEESEGYLEELSKGVESFEEAHPQLTALVSRISNFLSNSGI